MTATRGQTLRVIALSEMLTATGVVVVMTVMTAVAVAAMAVADATTAKTILATAAMLSVNPILGQWRVPDRTVPDLIVVVKAAAVVMAETVAGCRNLPTQRRKITKDLNSPQHGSVLNPSHGLHHSRAVNGPPDVIDPLRATGQIRFRNNR